MGHVNCTPVSTGLVIKPDAIVVCQVIFRTLVFSFLYSLDLFLNSN
jgi:hypothetical protein